MVQTRIDSIGRVRALERRKSFYALEVLPKMGQAAGRAWAGVFARLPEHEQRAIITRLTAKRVRYWARRMGYPDPILEEAVVRPLPGGGHALVATRPLRSAWGGDGRTVENSKGERPRTEDNFELRMAAEKFKAQLAERGIDTIVADPNSPDPLTILQAKVPERKAKAR